MVRTADIVADRLGRIGAEKNSTRVADPLTERLGVRGHDLEMFWGKPVGERDAFLKIGDKDNRAEIAPARRRDFFAREISQLPRDRGLDGTGEARVIGDQNRLRRGVVFGLREEIGGDPFGIGAIACNNQDLGRPSDHVDANGAENPPLGRGHISIARTDDLGDWGDGLSPISQRRDRLRAPDPINLIDAGELGRRQNKRIDPTLRRRDGHDNAGDARQPWRARRSSRP